MNDSPDSRSVIEPNGTPDITLPIVVYALLLAGVVSGGLTAIVGVVIAYVYRGQGPHWFDEHYRYQIRTFWLSVLYFAISGVLTLVMIGFVTWLLAVVWLVVRCVKGIKRLQEHREPDNVDAWLI
ncbi:DUF4870 family protein [Billgrantia desiderata]|uniref:Transmembrane protein n=1 Tax=Billgrantia desiderata TaxID=52021 RepID=A0AAW4YPI5_9GAMM|nr:hypothetical protein [Halomonas desiderata]MCE8011767.1 hypothetical protein [Halomonas desiderata]MCE8043512.1 hypothetical protein [Halomonas desiderata]MCE8048086.1 hypothetical protein [Halomonas desiderata]MCE8049907.1 hypothetical protein [Halomonas desiderata]OUE38825.1 hypothetical protein BZY95_17625 [Halomonas desiderata SP1]